MGEKMEKVEIEPGIIDPSKEEIESLTGKGAKEGLIPWIPGEWKKGIATALGLATAGGVGAGAGVAAFNWYVEHHPAIVEPASAAQIPPEIVVSSEIRTASEYIEKAPVEVEEIAPIIKEVSVEQTVEFLQGLEGKVNEIKHLRSLRVGDDPEIPTLAIGKIFARLENDVHSIQGSIDSGQNETPMAKERAREVMGYWNVVSMEVERVKEPEILVDPATGKQGRWVEAEIKNVVDLLPNLGRAVGEIEIVPRVPEDPLRGRTWTYPDRPATIRLYDTKEEGEQWTRESLTLAFFHELRHAISLYGEGYVLTLLTPSEVIELVHEDTVLWDIIYRPDGGKPVFGGGEEEENAFFAESLLSSGGSSIGFQPNTRREEIVEKARNHLEKLYGLVLNEKRNIIEPSEVLGVR